MDPKDILRQEIGSDLEQCVANIQLATAVLRVEHPHIGEADVRLMLDTYSKYYQLVGKVHAYRLLGGLEYEPQLNVLSRAATAIEDTLIRHCEQD